MTNLIEKNADFTTAIGAALLEWGVVELSHSTVFRCGASGQDDNTPLYAAYWAIVSFEGRQKMVDAALRDALYRHPELLARWNTLNNRLVKKNQVRNRIAHAQLVQLETITKPKHTLLVPYLWGKINEHHANSFEKGMAAQDISAIAVSFRALASDLDAFLATLRKAQMLAAPQGRQVEAQALRKFHPPWSPTPPESAQSDQPPQT